MKLNWKEVVGVVAVGLAASYAARAAQNRARSPQAHQLAMLIGGAALYTAGVVIGTRRPEGGWAGLLPGPTH